MIKYLVLLNQPGKELIYLGRHKDIPANRGTYRLENANLYNRRQDAQAQATKIGGVARVAEVDTQDVENKIARAALSNNLLQGRY